MCSSNTHTHKSTARRCGQFPALPPRECYCPPGPPPNQRLRHTASLGVTTAPQSLPTKASGVPE
eukprot:8641300-Alexandrium_andersonii.AAC.1